MNFARHAAWMMNPNLSGNDVLRLVEQDIEQHAQLRQQVAAAADRLRDEHGEETARRYLTEVRKLLVVVGYHL